MPTSMIRSVLAIVIVGACGVDQPSDFAPLDPVVDCVGVPAERCREAVQQALADPANRPRMTAIRIRCSVPSCTIREGQMSVTVLLADGQQVTTTSGWAAAAGGVPAPGRAIEIPLPVTPTCAGVPRKTCEKLAMSSVQGMRDRPVDTVASIVVRCDAAKPCTETGGKGTTEVTFSDGTKQTSDWLFEGALSP